MVVQDMRVSGKVTGKGDGSGFTSTAGLKWPRIFGVSCLGLKDAWI